VSPGRGGGDVPHTFIHSARRLISLGVHRLGGRNGVRRLRCASREHAGFRQAAADSGLCRHRCVRRALHHPAQRFYFFARPDERRQSRLRLFELDHRGPQRLHSRASGCRARSGGIGACCSRHERSPRRCERRHRESRLRAAHFIRASFFYAGNDISSAGKACRFIGTSVPNAAYARSDRGRCALFFLRSISSSGGFFCACANACRKCPSCSGGSATRCGYTIICAYACGFSGRC